MHMNALPFENICVNVDIQTECGYLWMSIPANLPVAKDARYWLKMQTHARIFAVHVYYRILSYLKNYIILLYIVVQNAILP